ncbi:aldehyde dehydrogenase family protein, partial [Candidatus Woesearchaeota archaeon]|nr:aldehyde dehydrogenase family protein [Candidatus Woesearchaeota archaeon]
LPSGVATRECYILEQPKGIIASITPWNYPIAIPVWHIAPAVLRGNCVLLKPSEEAPMTAYELSKDIHRAGFPTGVINIVFGADKAGNALAAHTEVNAIIFTGSSAVSQKLQHLCADNPWKSLASEAGGKNAMVVLDDANLDNAIESCALSWLKTTGQRCVSAERIIVQAGIYDALKKGLLDYAASKLLIDDPVCPQAAIPQGGVHIGPLISKAGMDKVLYYNKLSREEGATILLEGSRKTGGKFDKGWYVTPHLYEMPAFTKARVLHEEVFGPHACLIKVKDIDEAIEVHNATMFGLSVGYCITNIDSAHRLSLELQAGVGYQNAPCIGAEVHLPFGGVKASGNDRPSGRSLLDFVVHKVARTTQFGARIQTAYAVEDGRKG